MTTYVHSDILDGGLSALQSAATQLRLLKGYTILDSYAVVAGNTVCTVSISSSDFSFSTVGSVRALTLGAKTGLATADSGAAPSLHFALTDSSSKVLWVFKAGNDVEVFTGRTIGFPSLVYSRQLGSRLDITTMTTPLYFGHAGNKQMYPEESTTGFNASVASGEIILDLDVWPLSGGASLAVMHDSDVSRTTSGTGLISSKSETQWNALTLDPSTYLGGGYPDTEAPPLLTSVLSTHVGDAIFSIEDKDSTAGSMTVLLAALSSAGVAPKQAVVSSFTVSHMAQIVSSGYESMFLTGSSTPVATVQSYGVGWAGVPTSMTNALITDYLNAGLKVVVWTINRRFTRDTYTAANPTITGFFSDDSKYLGSATAITTTDRFSTQHWDHGMYASDDAMTAASRGEFFAPDYWGYSSNEVTYRSCLMGFLSPVATPTNFVLDLKVTFDSANASDDSYYADVVVGTTDNGFANTASGLIGYVFRFHKNGTVAVYLKAWLTAPELKASTVGTTITAGAEKNFRITVTSTTVKAAQVDGSGVDITAASWANASSRGGYITFGRAGLACKFRDVVVT